MIKFLLLIFIFLFCALWALIFTIFVRDKPKAYWIMIALIPILVYYLY